MLDVFGLQARAQSPVYINSYSLGVLHQIHQLIKNLKHQTNKIRINNQLNKKLNNHQINLLIYILHLHQLLKLNKVNQLINSRIDNNNN
jgi:hypothetical protein